MHKIRKMFSALPDPRAPNALHDLLDVIVIALATVLCGGQGATDMEVFASSKEKLLREFLRLPHGIPSHDTFSRVLNALDPEAFERAFRSFMAAFAEANGIKLTGVVAVDGKAVRGAYERGRSATPLHMVNVFATEARMALAACKAPGRNETEGALDVLQMLSLEGCIVTADALHCNRPFAKKVLERGGHYVLALKENQEQTVRGRRALLCPLRQAQRGQAGRAVHPRSIRIQARHRHSQHQSGRQTAFPELVAVGPHHLAPTTAWQTTPASPPCAIIYCPNTVPPKRLLQIIRSHWSIENQLHWVLDVVFGEDGCRTRKNNGPENSRSCGGLAINLVRAHPDPHLHAQKVKRAGWEDAFLLSLICHMR